jgi:hypothetical protein
LLCRSLGKRREDEGKGGREEREEEGRKKGGRREGGEEGRGRRKPYF